MTSEVVVVSSGCKDFKNTNADSRREENVNRNRRLTADFTSGESDYEQCCQNCKILEHFSSQRSIILLLDCSRVPFCFFSGLQTSLV